MERMVENAHVRDPDLKVRERWCPLFPRKGPTRQRAIVRVKEPGVSGAYLKLSASRPSRYLMAELTKVAGKAMANHRASIRPKPRTSRKTILFTIWPSSSATQTERKVLASSVNVAHVSRPISRLRHPGTMIFSSTISCRKKSRSSPKDNLCLLAPFPAESEFPGGSFRRTVTSSRSCLERDRRSVSGMGRLRRARMCGQVSLRRQSAVAAPATPHVSVSWRTPQRADAPSISFENTDDIPASGPPPRVTPSDGSSIVELAKS